MALLRSNRQNKSKVPCTKIRARKYESLWCLLNEKFLQLLQCFTSVRDLVLLRLVHLGVGSVVALRLEARVPTKVSGSTWGHDLPGSPAFEEHDVFGAASSLRVPENAHSVGRLVFKVSDEPWQAVGAKVF